MKFYAFHLMPYRHLDMAEASKYRSYWSVLPNRLYEGGLFNAIAIAREGTATGDKVAREGLGVTLNEPIDVGLTSWLLTMDAGRYAALAEAARRAPRSLFVDEMDTAQLLARVAESRTC